MKKRTYFIGLTTLIYFLLGLGNPAVAEGFELVDLLVKNIGITTKQAEGGAGSIFDAAKKNMGVEDFLKITTAMPEVEALMAGAPKINTGSSALGGLSSMLSENAGSVGKMASLYASFAQLGLSQEMVGKFIPVIYDYAKSKGGETVFNLLKTALQ